MQQHPGDLGKPLGGRRISPSNRYIVRPTQEGYDTQPKQPLPPPTGQPPYHLSIDQVLPTATLQTIQSSGRLVFHTAGDTGGLDLNDQAIVIERMIQDCNVPDPSACPAYFYHLGDVVYFFGQADGYANQFYQAYQYYPPHILAIPGNHDGAIDPSNPSATSLAAFVNNFCAPMARLNPEAGDTGRHAMIQPNVYWTLDTPFATFIGLYTNVPEGGWMDDKQIAWFENELRTAPTNKALILAMHHSIYTGDLVHGPGKFVGPMLENAIQQTGRLPDIVLSGHVHDYQRFTRKINGRDLPFVVAGGGGYPNLYPLSESGTLPQPTPIPGVTLENYCYDRNGYLLMEVTAQTIKGEYFTVPRYGQPDTPPQPQPFDSFTLNWQTHQLQ